jgi:AraC-like DNA-binding protein
MTVKVAKKIQLPHYRFSDSAYNMVQVIFVTRGQLGYRVHSSATCHTLDPGMFILLRLGSQVDLFCHEQGYEGIAVFQEDTSASIFYGPPVTGTSDQTLQRLVAMLSDQMEQPIPESPAILQGLGQALIWKVLAATHQPRKEDQGRWATAAKAAIESNLTTGHSVQKILSALPLSQRQLYRCFQEAYGMSPKAFLEQLRIEEACRMLKDTQMEITFISIELGYSSSQHFATRFRKAKHCTPSTYRQNKTPSLSP